MIIVSNNLLSTTDIQLSKDTIIRVNLAWMDSIEEAQSTLNTLSDREYVIYLDYPQGRTKPPVPVVSLETAVLLANSYKSVKYFAVSNVEDPTDIRSIEQLLRDDITLVPKIETSEGVLNFDKIMRGLHSNVAMLDKEDLYLSIKGDAVAFNAFVNTIRKVAQDMHIELLELRGVVFS